MNPFRRQNWIGLSPSWVGRLVRLDLMKNSRGCLVWRDLDDFSIRTGERLDDMNEIGLVVEEKVHEDILFYRVLFPKQGPAWIFHWEIDDIEVENS